jgi:hypothetical protein
MENSEQNQNNKESGDGVFLGEPCFFQPDDADVFTPERIRRFSEAVLNAETWFCTADELIGAMELLEPQVERFWDDVRSIGFAVDVTSDESSTPQRSDAPSEKQNAVASSTQCLIDQHMMLAGFAIENLCKGHLVSRLSDAERDRIRQEGILPRSFQDHHSLSLVKQTGMSLTPIEELLLTRITQAVLWRGRYPSPTSHGGIGPYAQMGSDIRDINALLQKLRGHVGVKTRGRK